MTKRNQKIQAKIGNFMQQYSRKAQRGQEPNDRSYSRAIEAKLKRMKPEEVDELLHGEDDEWVPQPAPAPKNEKIPKDATQGPLRRGT